MTDVQMDERLRVAGERWRAGAGSAHQQSAPALGALPALSVPPSRRRSRRFAGRRTWVAAAAVLVLASAVTVGALVTGHVGRQPAVTSKPDIRALIAYLWSEPAHPERTIEFTPKQARLSDGCFTESRRLELIGQRLVVGARVGPSSVCGGLPGIAREHPDAFDVVSGSVAWSVDGNTLTLTKAGVGTLSYVGQTPAEALASKWKLVQTRKASGNRDSTVDAPTVAEVFLIFDGAGRYTVRYRCGDAEGAAAIGRHTIHLGPAAVEHAGLCPAPAADTAAAEQAQEALVADVVRGTVSWSIAGRRLTIARGGDAAIFDLVNGY